MGSLQAELELIGLSEYSNNRVFLMGEVALVSPYKHVLNLHRLNFYKNNVFDSVHQCQIDDDGRRPCLLLPSDRVIRNSKIVASRFLIRRSF